MILKKSITIGMIILFIGSALLPMSGATEVRSIKPVKIDLFMMNTDGVFETRTLLLKPMDLAKLITFIDSLKLLKSRGVNIKDILGGTGVLGDILNLEWLDKLPGKPIISCGQGRTYLTPYHARVQIKKILTTWNYQKGFGTTVIWGNGLSSPPTQILLKRQIGFMVGFVGLYIYIPPLVQGMPSRTLFIGSSMFAWGASI